MFIHLGGDVIIPKEEVIAILSTQLFKKTETNKEFLQVAEEDGFISPITDSAKAKSVIITTKKIYFSPISSFTLKKRSDELLEK
jgi:hypothetical protein